MENGTTHQMEWSSTNATQIGNWAIGNTTNGGTIKYKEGVFPLSTAIIDSGYDNVVIEGCGDATVFNLTENVDGFSISSVSGWKLKNFRINGNSQIHTVAKNNIVFNDCSNITVSGITSLYAESFNIHLNNCTNFVVENNFVEQEAVFGHDGIHCTDCKNGTVHSNVVHAGDDAVCLRTDYENVSSITVYGNFLSSKKANGVRLGQSGRSKDASEVRRVDNIVISSNTIYGCANSGIEVRGGFMNDLSFVQNSTVIGNSISSCVWSGIRFAHARGLTVTGNTFSNIGYEAIQIGEVGNYTYNIIVDGFSISNSGSTGSTYPAIQIGSAEYYAYDITVANGVVDGVGGSNVGCLLRWATNCTISNVNFKNIAGADDIIEYGSGNDYNLIIGCRGYKDIDVNGTNTHIVASWDAGVWVSESP